MKYTNTDKAPAAIGRYSQAVTAGGFLLHFRTDSVQPGNR